MRSHVSLFKEAGSLESDGLLAYASPARASMRVCKRRAIIDLDSSLIRSRVSLDRGGFFSEVEVPL